MTKNSSRPLKIAIQGTIGSFHYEVAKKLYGADNEFIECMDFNEIPILLKQQKIDKGIMAIENTIAGAILPNYALIDEYDLRIKGEYYLPIQHHLMALPGQKIADIKEVWSHPMALLQCRKFFRDYPQIKLVEAKDTAEMAKLIQQKQLKGIAGIAGYEAADIYQLDIIAESIQTNKINATRFFVLDNDTQETPTDFNKVSVKFTLSHETGSLHKVLQIFANNKLNMSKIQSLPIIDKPWEYAFFVDLIVNCHKDYQKAVKLVAEQVLELKILGAYINHKMN
jgi:prephenate dehydratase